MVYVVFVVLIECCVVVSVGYVLGDVIVNDNLFWLVLICEICEWFGLV